MPTWSSRPNLVAPQTPVIWWFPFRKHWSNVLVAKPTTHRLFLEQRVQARPDGFSNSSRGNQNNWCVRFEPMELAAKLSNNSAPRIDCMPYAAWRQAGRLAVVILQSAAEHTQSKGFDVSASCKGLQRYFVVASQRILRVAILRGRLLSSLCCSPFVLGQHGLPPRC